MPEIVHTLTFCTAIGPFWNVIFYFPFPHLVLQANGLPPNAAVMYCMRTPHLPSVRPSCLPPLTFPHTANAIPPSDLSTFLLSISLPASCRPVPPFLCNTQCSLPLSQTLAFCKCQELSCSRRPWILPLSEFSYFTLCSSLHMCNTFLII